MLLPMLLMNCKSAKIEKTRVPEIAFPIFPNLEGGSDNKDGTVTVSSDWLVRLAEYKLRIEETEKSYNDLKALYED